MYTGEQDRTLGNHEMYTGEQDRTLGNDVTLMKCILGNKTEH